MRRKKEIKKTKIVACCVITATLGIVRTGCGDSDIDKDAESPNVGTWAAKVLESEGVEYDVEEAMGVTAFPFNADDTFLLLQDDERTTDYLFHACTLLFQFGFFFPGPSWLGGWSLDDTVPEVRTLKLLKINR